MSGRKVRLNVGFVCDGKRKAATDSFGNNSKTANGNDEIGSSNVAVLARGNRRVAAVCKGDVYSSRMEMLASRASVLNAKDRTLLKMYLKNGSSFRQVARLTGTNEATVARRINKLISRLVKAEYIICLRNRRMFEKIELAIARDFFIDGLTRNKIAIKRDVSMYIVRKTLLKVQQVAKENT